MTSTPALSDASTERIAAAANALIQRGTPTSTYRLQFSAAFTFRDALALVPYLDDLGVTDVYASPILKAAPGSTHGYDVCDHSQLNPELGTMDDFLALSAALKQREMGLIVDIVPNHMGINNDCNPWWTDVLENGPISPYANYFDIDWDPVKPALKNKVLLPILEDQYGNVLEAGRFSLSFVDGAFWLHYFDHRLPLAPRTYRMILEFGLELLKERLPDSDDASAEYQSILTALSYLPSRLEEEPEKSVERQREKEVIKRRLAALYNGSSAVQTVIDEAVLAFSGTPDEPETLDRLDELINAQPYRLAYWRVAAEEINYRRFFDVNTMAAICVELPEVFRATHDLTLRLLADGHIRGLRIDHPDGLWNPQQYFRTLQASAIAYCVGDPELTTAAETWLMQQNLPRNPVYVVAEKILTETEPLPYDWAVMGTTGYDFAALANGLFVDSNSETAFSQLYREFTGVSLPFVELEYTMKRRIMRESLPSEMNALAHQLERTSQRNRHYRDFTLYGLLQALREIIANLSIYRTYIDEKRDVSERDAAFIIKAVSTARRRNPGISRTIFNFIRDTLLLRNLDTFREEDRSSVVDFVMHFQQMTGPVMAKSVEDTSFYIFNRLVSLNEVGGNPSVFGVSPEAFHEQTARRQREWPESMLALSTHDTKRSEDVRARLNVLSEIPDQWREALKRWSAMNAAKKQVVDDEPAPSANDEYLLYQTLLGAWPFDGAEAEDEQTWHEFRERIRNYMAKATKEAKARTSWTNPDEEYDRAVAEFVDAVLQNRDFIRDFLPLQRQVAFFGGFNSLSQTLLKLACPGVPDTYRGTELWDYSLVDPDNRRPVDYARCQSILAELMRCLEVPGCDRAAVAEKLLQNAEDGRIKLFTSFTTLNFRRQRDHLFRNGEYRPLVAAGEHAGHVCAFERWTEGESIVVIVPRLIVGLMNGKEQAPLGKAVWGNTSVSLQAGRYRNVFTGETHEVEDEIELGDVLGRFPVALLVHQ